MSSATTRSLLDVLSDIFFVFDEDGRLVEWNEAAVEVTGYSDEELRSMSPVDFFDGTDVEAVEQAIGEVLETGDATVQAALVTAADEHIPYEFSVSRVIDDEGDPVGFAGIGRDFTETLRERERLHQRERTLRTMHEIIADRDTPFEEQVQALLDLGREVVGVEYGTLSRIRGDDYVFEVVSVDDDSIEAGDVVPVSATNCEVVATTERTLVAGDVGRDVADADQRAGYTDWGIECYLGAPVFVDDEVYGTFCLYGTAPRPEEFSEWEVTLVDLMSRWVSYELQRRSTRERLKRQNETLERFTSMVSHDLRSPLNVVSGSLDLAERTGDPEHFERCQQAVDRMDSLVVDLLSLARAGMELREVTDVGLGTLARQCWQTVPSSRATLQAETRAVVCADETRLRQLLENLFQNSVEHCVREETGDRTDGEHVTITVGDLDGGFFVEDDGRGIPPEERDRVFESGYSSRREGTGFGLDIVRRVADVHGWEVTLTESAEGGARFEFTGVATAG
ncbi:two-component system sensor histidine kinase/response regulator [Salinigranum rubrum]|uniref:histidine kinase n=1 Tax=Salinigranum rubrum TaxID=755307 RepID=A0A2I8VFQ7_9EURY|nr:ATP-binding protein [Salinigranum rubrum]AUV80768.1 two-component system sensor histidine kinase/response regulator [Salinigranum rubrum]